MTTRRFRSGDKEECVLFNRGIDREWTRRSRDVDGQIDEMESTRQSRLPTGRRPFDRFANRIIADEILLAHERVGCCIESRRCGADLLSITLDAVVERRGLESQRDLGELL